MVDLRSPSRLAVVVGGLACLASMFLPWFRTRSSGDDALHVVPFTTDVLRAGVVLVVVVLIAGLVIFVAYGSPAIVGCISALLFNCAIAVWIAGSRAALLVPPSVLPENVAVSLGVGASLGVAGSIAGLVGSAFVLAEQTWTFPACRSLKWVQIIAIPVVALCLGIRELGWVRVTGGGLTWELDFDVVPVIGDALSVLLVVAVTMVAVTFFGPRRWASIVLMACGSLVGFLAVIAVFASALIERGASELLNRLDFLPGQDAAFNVTGGPWAFLLVGVLLALYGLVALRQSERRVPFRRLISRVERFRGGSLTSPIGSGEADSAVIRPVDEFDF